MASSSSSSSCHVAKIKHDVFISFRGTDVRRNLLSHLVKELRREKIDVYVDYRLERGDEISSLFKAIEGSQVFLVIFSKDYASSKWCLDELVKMMECVEKNKQILIPVFYNIEPSDVGNQRKGYGAALAEHVMKEDKVKVQNWRSALEKAAQFSGLHYPLNFENESNLVDEIVKGVSNQLNKFCSSDLVYPSKSNGLVGIDQNITWIKSLLTTERREALMLGIWGMGGIGKTTIARIAFDTFSPQYEGCCFLENVREELEKHQLSYLRDKLVSRLLEEENPHIGTGKANSSTKRKLSRMKVLIVLDDVNTPKDLKDLLEPNWFGLGSCVIVTSRDFHVFTAGRFHRIHEVKELNFEESLKLFCINAFDESQPKMGYEELSKKAVAIAKGVPLALKVFGSYFHSKESKDIWECALEQFKKYPDEGIQSVLRLSYDELRFTEKNVFLDVAFFFKDEDKGYVINRLNAWGFHGASGIEVLKDKALVTISNDNRIQMHDLIQEMGWEVVREESKVPGRRSRLRDAEDVYDVLKNNKGTDLVEGILFDASQIGEVALILEGIKSLPNLRLLKLYSPLPIEVPVQIICFVAEDSARGSRFDIITRPFVNHPQWSKMAISNECEVVLVSKTNTVSRSNQIIGSALKDLMSLGSEVHIKSLHYLSGCASLSKDAQMLQEEIIRIANSSSADTVIQHENVAPEESSAALPNEMRQLNIMDTMVELFFYSTVDLSYLQHDNVIPIGFQRLPNEMRQLNLKDTRMELLNPSLGHYFSSLECSDIDGIQLETLQNEFPMMRFTRYHKLYNCREQDAAKPKLLVLFDGFRYSKHLSSFVLPGFQHYCGKLRQLLWGINDAINFHGLQNSLELLVLDGSNIDRLPSAIKHLSRLKALTLKGCRFLRSIPELPPSIHLLDASNCALLETVAFSSSTDDGSSSELAMYICLQNCMSLDTEKFDSLFHRYARTLPHGYELRREDRSYSHVSVCYPGSKVPEWFSYQTLGDSITVELIAPLSNGPFGCLLCFVLSRSNHPLTVKVECQSYCEDGSMPKYGTNKIAVLDQLFEEDLYSDHVCMWYLESHAMSQIMEGIVNDQRATSSYDPKVTLRFSFGVKSHSNGLIKECGICPLYRGDCHNFVKTKRPEEPSRIVRTRPLRIVLMMLLWILVNHTLKSKQTSSANL